MSRSVDVVLSEFLVLRSQSGEREAFNELVTLWSPQLLRFCWRRTGNSEAAHDAVQTIWLQTVKGLRKLDDPTRFPAWLFTIAARTCADHVRSQIRQRALDEKIDAMPPAAEAAPNEASSDLKTAIGALTPDKRRILTLRYRDGHSVDEIAALMDIPAGTVKSRLHSLRNELRQHLEGEDK